MYSCRLRIYLAGQSCRAFEVIKEMPSMEHFTHIFFEGDSLEGKLASEADVIIADLSDLDVTDVLHTLTSNIGSNSQVILLADRSQMQALTGSEAAACIKDIWVNPMSDEEVRFHFLRWQQSCKMEKDFWQTSQYLEETIDHIPNLVWYKDKNGIHEKVNESFCQTVRKTKQQVQGRGHAYIWDVEQDDPACIESENKVMSEKRTFISGEIIDTGEGKRTLTTYKSPLYDLMAVLWELWEWRST